MSNTYLPMAGSNVEKENYVVLNLKTLDPLSRYSVEMSTVYAHG